MTARPALKGLRPAEKPPWKSNIIRFTRPATAKSPRLPVAPSNASEGRLFALLAILGLGCLAYSLWGTLDMAEGWTHFTLFVQQLFG